MKPLSRIKIEEFRFKVHDSYKDFDKFCIIDALREIYVPQEAGDNELYNEIHTNSTGINSDDYENIKVEVGELRRGWGGGA